MPFKWELGRPWRSQIIKNLPKSPGIYMIECIATKKRYIGASVNIYKRVRNHLQLMSISKDHSPIAEDYLTYGKESIQVTVLEKVKDKGKLAERESYWQSILLADDNAYNTEPSKSNRFWQAIETLR